jgi:ribosome-associated heat shock protein Hsp15
METTRIDKYLWTVRIFKTRSDAAEACKSGKIKVNDLEAKASREIKPGDTITVKKMPVIYTFKVLGITQNRQSAKNVALYVENLTPEEELSKLHRENSAVFIQRDRGAGRPTKKERRELDQLFDDIDNPL